MPFHLDQLRQSLGETGIRRLALGCNLLLLGWIAWMVAQSILTWQQPETDTQTAGLPEERVARTAETRNSARHDIASWHLFGQPSDQHAEVSPAKINAPETRLNLELNGVYLGDSPEHSRAIIAEKGKQQEHYQAGDQLPGNAVLDEIHAEHVLLKRNGRYERLALTEKRTTASSGINRSARHAPKRAADKPGKPQTHLPSEVQSISKLLSLHPVMSDGVFKGMTVRGINSKGRRLLKAANVKIKQNDVVTAINGIEIESAEAGKTLLDNYTTTERLELIIKRGRKRIPVTIDPDASN
jgi:general secretion pathway protein C